MKKKEKKSRGRPIDGIFLLDKPKGITSNAALQAVKAMFFVQKAGHTGSLDPLATGMLPICFGEATKFSQYLLNADKTYEVIAKLGERTDTCDSEGTVIETKPVNISKEQILKVLPQFRGETMQIPSMFSALKHKGEPLYKLARQGIEIEREARPIMIYKLELLDLTDDRFTLTVHCSKGTYVRNLVDDIGQVLGCGAHVVELRRLGVAGFTTNQMITMEQLESFKKAEAFAQMDALLLPMSSALDHLPVITLSEVAAFQLMQGNPVQVFKAPAHGFVRLHNHLEKFIGIGEMQNDGKVAPRRLIET